MEIQTIPIVYASDENFLAQTYVSIYSVLANRKSDYFIHFYLMVPEGCEEKHFDEQWKYDKYVIDYIYIEHKCFANVEMTLQHISKPTYYRLLIPLYLSKYDKCIYLDGDTLCCDDIITLYSIDIADNLLAATMGAMVYFDEMDATRRLGVPSAKHYVNAGVLVMNLKEMRNENKVEQFLECSKRQLHCQDQDVLNICCYGRIKLLPLKYNIYSNVFVMPEKITEQRFSKNEIEKAIKYPCIIHYPGEFSKPWNNIYSARGIIWWQNAAKALPSYEQQRFHMNAIERMNKYSYAQLFDKIQHCTFMIIFGFSEIGRKLCDEIDRKYPNRIVAFCDNDLKKIGHVYKKYEVLPLAQIKEQYMDALVLISSQNYSSVIEKQLIEEGFRAENIVVYRKKTLNYMYSVERKYWDIIMEDIRLDDISYELCCDA